MSLIADVFPKYRQQRTWLLKCLKSPVTEHLWTINMLNGPKHCPNLDNCSFAIFGNNFSSKNSV